MSDRPPVNGTTQFRLDVMEARLRAVEEQNLAVVIRDVQHLDEKMDNVIRALWVFAGGLGLAVITFALSVASGQIG